MNIGFVSTRLAGSDGVTLETIKWAQVCRKLGHETFFCAGQLDRELTPSLLVPKAHFNHPEIIDVQQQCFGVRCRPAALTDRIHELRCELKLGIREFVSRFGIDLLIPQNALTIPMNIPLGVALTEHIAETGIPTIAHHHDFYWERQRFMINAVQDFLDAAFPPNAPTSQACVGFGRATT